jgi:hypothetical protein
MYHQCDQFFIMFIFIYVKSYCKANNFFENMNFMMYWQGINILKIILFLMVNELSQYDMGIAFK